MKVSNWKNIIVMVLMTTASAQLWGQPLAPTKWHRIRTPYVDVIFRGNIEREAQRLANRLEYVYEPVIQSLGTRPSRVALIIRNQEVCSNGFVALGPHRVELDTFPSQDYNFIGTNDWLSLLTVHEFRHVAQYAHLKQNFNVWAYRLGGDPCLGAMIFLNVPVWFLEGDTTSMETALTQGGRGRIPYFSLRYRVNLLTRNPFSYAKLVFGSFKDEVPNCYALGYHLITYLRRKYGPEVVADILQRTTLPRLFTTAVRQTTRNTLLQICADANRALKAHWEQQLQDLKLTQATGLNRRTHTDYIDYAYPQLDKEGNTIVLKSGIGTVAQFVKLDGKQRERHLLTPGNIIKNTSFSIAQNKMMWVETIPHSRWEKCSYGVIKYYDIQTKRLKTLRHKGRYGSAALSPDATQIVAFESDEAYNHQLVILDAETGQVVKRLPNPDNHFYLTPQWSEDGRQVLVVKNVQQKVTLSLIDIRTGEAQDLLPYSTEPIGCPTMKGKYVLYNSAYSGIDNIYAIDTTTRQRYQVTSRTYGAYNPIVSADDSWLIFNDFTRDGMDVVKTPFNPKQWTLLEEVENRSLHYYAPLVTQEGSRDVLAHLPNNTYPIQRYPLWRAWPKVHGWLTIKGAPINARNPKRPSELLQQLQLNILKASNLLGTTALDVDYLHNFKENKGQPSVKISYQGWYPVFSLEGNITKDYKSSDNSYDPYLGLTLGLPWQFMQGQYTHVLSLKAIGALEKEGMFTFYRQTYKSFFSRSSKKSDRDIYHPWRQELEILYRHTPLRGNYQDQYLGAYGELSFPGLRKHHSLRLRAVYGRQHKMTTRPGYYRAYAKGKRRTMIFNYDFPIFYPDWDMGYLLYVKRLRANIFYSWTDNVYPNKDTTRYANNVSLDLLADLHPTILFNIPLLSVGIKYLYSLEQRSHMLTGVFYLTLGPSSTKAAEAF